MGMKPRTETDTEKLKRHNRELSILNKIAEALNREVDLPRALQTAMAQVTELFDLETSWVFLRNEKTEKFYAAATRNLPPALADHPRRLGGTCACLDEYVDGDLPRPRNITCTRLENLVVGTLGLKFHASIPLNAHGKELGVLNVVSTTDWEELSEGDLRLLQTVGDLMSIAIERTMLFNQSAEFGATQERNRIAREIHDTIAQGLAAITLQLEAVDAMLETGAEEAKIRQTVQQALSTTRANLEEARRSVLDLRAAPLEGKTLPEAISELVRECQSRTRMKIEYDVMGIRSRPLPVRIAVGIYRIAQEALNNVIRHAQAVHVIVILEATPQTAGYPEHIHLVIEDDGIGFDPTQIPIGHYGLIGLNERAKLLGGQLTIRSNPGVGTRIDFHIPLNMSRE